MGIIRQVITGVVGVGIVSAGVWALDNTTRDENGTIVSAGELGVFNFALGDCITGLPNGPELALDKATGVPCSDPHQTEVYAETFLGDDVTDIPADISEQADNFCYSKFEEFIGIAPESTALGVVTLYPTPESWAGGDKELTCMVGELLENGDYALSTGSLKGSKK